MPRLLGGGVDADDARQREEVERVAQAISGRAARGLRRGQRLDAGEVRCAEPAGIAPPGRRRRGAAPVPEIGVAGDRESVVRGIRRAQGEEQALGADLSRVEEVPRRSVPVVPRSRVHLRQLYVQLEAGRREVLDASSGSREIFHPQEQTPLPSCVLPGVPKSGGSVFSSSSFCVSSVLGIWISIFDGSTVLLTRLPVTIPGKAITMLTMITWMTTTEPAP